MADSIVKLRVDSKNYDANLKSARQGLLAMEQACRKVGGTFEVVEKEELEFIKALGKMDSASMSSRQQLRDLTNTINDMTGMYKRMTAEEKSSAFGQSLSAGIKQLKTRAADLQDQMADLNEELRHMASDTAFTDGVNLMTSTVGSCASAIVAWSGDGKEMEQVIKDLAKIQTTITAVESLTKAFQKQNLVLLKNPYVLAATAIAAAGVAIYEFTQRTEEATDAEKRIAAVSKQVTEAHNNFKKSAADMAGAAIGEYFKLQNQWKNLSSEHAKNEWIKDNETAFKNLGLKINDAKSAESVLVNNTDNVVKALIARAKAIAGQDMLVDAYKKYYDKLNSVDSVAGGHYYKTATRDNITATEKNSIGKGAIANSYLTNEDVAKINEQRKAAAQKLYNQNVKDITEARDKAVDTAKKVMQEGQDEVAKYSNLVDPNAGKGGSGSGKGTTPKAAKPEDTYAEGSVADLTKQIQDLQKEQQSVATTADAWADYQAKIDAIIERVKVLKGEVAQVKEPETVQGQSFGLSSAGMGGYISMMQQELAQADFGTPVFQSLQANLQDASALSAIMQTLVDNGVQNADLTATMELLWDKILGTDGDALGALDWTALQDAINEALAGLEIEPIKLDISTGSITKATKETKAMSAATREAFNAVNTLGGAMQQIKNPAVNIAGTIAQAIANVALAYGDTMAKDQASKSNIFSFIAAAAAATVSMVTTIAAIKQNAKFADGGMVSGSSYVGDKIPAMLNAGEVVLNYSQQQNLASNLEARNTTSGGGNSTISGEQIVTVINAYGRRTGRGEILR